LKGVAFMFDWHDEILNYMRENDHSYFTIEYIANVFNLDIQEVRNFFEFAEKNVDLIGHFTERINNEEYELYTLN
jgi:hypothetical protein